MCYSCSSDNPARDNRTESDFQRLELFGGDSGRTVYVYRASLYAETMPGPGSVFYFRCIRARACFVNLFNSLRPGCAVILPDHSTGGR